MRRGVPRHRRDGRAAVAKSSLHVRDDSSVRRRCRSVHRALVAHVLRFILRNFATVRLTLRFGTSRHTLAGVELDCRFIGRAGPLDVDHRSHDGQQDDVLPMEFLGPLLWRKALHGRWSWEFKKKRRASRLLSRTSRLVTRSAFHRRTLLSRTPRRRLSLSSSSTRTTSSSSPRTTTCVGRLLDVFRATALSRMLS